jgi:phage tail sheath protein FI
MPEYLAPGVYVEEVSFRFKSIEGVPTSTTGFAGVTRYGPVQYDGGPKATRPRLITSFAEFERVYGGLSPLELEGGDRDAYLAHAARAFFKNGGQRLYISRVFAPPSGQTVGDCIASLAVTTTLGSAAWKARWPGEDGNVLVDCQAARSKNLAFEYAQDPNDILARHTWGIQAKSVKAGAVVEITPQGNTLPTHNDALSASALRVVAVDSDGRQSFLDGTGSPATVAPGSRIALVELRVTVRGSGNRVDSYDGLAAHSGQLRFVGKVLELDDPDDENALVWLDWAPGSNGFAPAALMIGLQSAAKRLSGGNDGSLPGPDALRGGEADPDDMNRRATGMEALGELDDIAIVAVPDGGAMPTNDEIQAVAGHLIAHAEKCRYRIAVVDAAANSSISEIREFRGKFDSKYAALYHPWIEILDPLVPSVPGVPPRKLTLPPSGFVTGIYARSDIARGVHKAPANEVVRGAIGFETPLNKAQQEVLSPEGVNCFRFFEGSGFRLWGARTMSSDPEWKYVSVRRYLAYLERSIDRGTQWAALEPNGEALWANVREAISDFLYNEWKNGALLGDDSKSAYFVRCDRSTMTQNDLDNGRMICLVGVAALKPTEFVIFRIGQWTADSKK